MNKKGFSLVELLAVIIVLSVILMITFPVVNNIVEHTKGVSAKSSAVEYAKTIASYYSIYRYDGDNTNDIPNEVSNYTNTSLEVKGNGPDSLNVRLSYGKVVSGYMIFDNYKIYFGDGKVTSVEKNTPSTGTPELCFEFDTETNTITDYYDFTNYDIYYPFSEEEHSLCTSDVIIPSTIMGVDVLNIGSDPFANRNITSVIIPNSVISIGESAFEDNQLTSVIIPNSVISIGESAFEDNQLTSVIIGNSVISIGDYAFSENQLTSVIIGNSVETIGSNAFYYNQLISVTIPNSVISIGDYAFSENQLTSITIGNSVETIESDAFSNNQLTSVTIPDSVINIGLLAFMFNDIVDIDLGNGVQTIGAYAFAYNQITSIAIPNSVTIIENGAFSDNQLTSIDIGNSITSIGNYAFIYNKIPQGSAIIRKASGTVSIGSSVFDNNGTNGTTTITPTYIP